MNPFQWQIDLAQQWLGLAREMTDASMRTWLGMSQQALGAWSGAGGGQLAGMRAPVPAAFGWPMPMPTWPGMGGAGAFPALPWMGMLNPGWAMGWQPPAAAWPWGMWPLQAAQGFQPAGGALLPWMWPWAQLLGPSVAPRSPQAEMLEQMATNYRTVTGYAVAAIVGPLGAALDPRTFGQPWWQAFPGKRPLN